MIQIATDSGLMPKPVQPQRDPARPGRAGRGDRRLRRRRGRVGRAAQRRATAAAATPPAPRPTSAPLMQFRVGSRPRCRTGPGCPAGCGRCPAWTQHVSQQARPHAGRSRSAASSRPTWLINGRTFNPARVRRLPAARHDRDLGDRQQDQRRPHDAPPPHRLVPARPQRQAAAALGRLPQGDLLPLPRRTDPRRRPLRDYTGKFVIHCHMLDHEDHGLMSQFQVVKRGSGR